MHVGRGIGMVENIVVICRPKLILTCVYCFLRGATGGSHELTAGRAIMSSGVLSKSCFQLIQGGMVQLTGSFNCCCRKCPVTGDAGCIGKADDMACLILC